MKRNYLTPIVRSVLAIALMASGAFVSAQNQWAKMQTSDPARPSGAVYESSPKSKAVGRRTLGDPANSVMPALDGLQEIRAPKSKSGVKLRPANIMRSPEAPRGHIYGVVNRSATITYAHEAYVGPIDLSTGALTPAHHGAVFCPYIGEDYVYQANSYRNGEVVCPRFTGGQDSQFTACWDLVDLETGDITRTIDFNDQLAEGYSVTYDQTRDIFYVVSIDLNTGAGDGIFGIVNPNGKTGWEYYYGGKLETANNFKPFIAGIAYNPVNDQLCAFDNYNTVYTIEWNGENGIYAPECTLVECGEIYMPNEGVLFDFPSDNTLAGPVTYSPTDEMFIAIYRDNEQRKNRIVYIHPETFEAFFGADITAPSTPFITSIFCVDDFASSDAPMLAANPRISFVKESLSGEISFTAPTESYVGVDLTGSDLKAVVKIDGNVADERTVKAGDSFTLPLTLTQGEHKLEFTTAIGDAVSPVNTTLFYTGYDAPVAPRNLTFDENTLTWDAPDAIGQHNGYVDVNDITYDVFVDGVKQNSAPLRQTTFKLTVPETMELAKISVTATSQGQTSLESSISQIFGKAFDLPFLQTPTKEQSQLYTIVNANGDVRQFYYGTNLKDYEGMIFVCGYIDDADDWLFLPAVNLPDADKLYSFDFDIRGVYPELTTKESFEIYVADKPTVAAAKKGTQIFADHDYAAMALNPVHHSYTFAVPKGGDYYLAIHVMSTRTQSSAGMSFHNFEVKAVDGASSAVPGEPTDLDIKAAEYGEQEAYVTATLPTVDILGKPLPADQDVTLTVAYTDQSGTSYSAKGTGKPGERITVTIGGEDGFIYYTVTPSNENGAGYTRSYRLYVGIDIPLHPDNIKGAPSDDNLSLHLTWDAPGKVGRNGGFVEVENLTYRVYTRSGVSYNAIGDTKDLEFTFYPFGQGIKTGTLESYLVGPAARNEAGESIESTFVMEALGTPYELPMQEEWNSTKFSYMPYNFSTSGEYQRSTWASTSTSLGLGIGDPSVVEGAVYSWSEAGACPSKIILPKATTIGIAKANFILKYWDYANAPKSIQIYGRRAGNHEEVFIGEYKLNNPARGEWVETELPLPAEFMNQSWIQLRIATNFTGKDYEYLFLDRYQIMPDADYDLKLTVLSGLNQATVGDVVTYDVTVANAGRERMEGPLKIELLSKDGKVLASDSAEVPQLTSNQTSEHSFSFLLDGSFRDEEEVTVRASVDLQDENLANNVREIELKLMPAQIPVVNDLQANVNDEGNVDLSWTASSATYGNFENFDTYKPFEITDHLGYWGNLDLDGMFPIYFQNQGTGLPVIWENSEEKCAWTVYKYDELNMIEPRIIPHSGSQALMARSGQSADQYTPEQSAKFLLSPEIVPQTSVSFWFSTLTSDTKEYIELWVYEGRTPTNTVNMTNDPMWRKVHTFSKVGSETWEFASYTFDRRARQFALRYASYDGYCAVIDDLTFTPANMLTRTAASYSVWRSDHDGSNPVMIAENITATSFTDTNYNDGSYRYYVVANADVDGNLAPGAPSNIVTVIGSSVGEIEGAQSVTAGSGTIFINNFAGEKAVIAAADGKIVSNAAIKSNSAAYAVEKGIYLVTIGKRTFKVIVR